jgi:uncharacterized damage-inducible protein DinB
MARYNRWQNQSVYAAAGGLTDAQRKTDERAFFKSIHATLNHLLWADQLWMSRFTDLPRPTAPDIASSVAIYERWEDLERERISFDETIIAWAEALDTAWLESDLTFFSGAAQREITLPAWLAVTHLFNHQTHHRAQAGTLLTRLGCKLDDTDIPLMAVRGK